MKTTQTRATRMFVSALAFGALATLQAQEAEATRTVIPAAQEAAAVDQDDVVVDSTRTLELPLLGITVQETKHVDQDSGHITRTAVDQAGRNVDVSDLLRQERALRAQTPEAKLHPDLAQRFADDPETAQEVVLWLAYDSDALDARAVQLDAELPEEPTEAQLEALETEMATFAMQLVEETAAPVLAELSNLGVDVRYTSTSAPAIFVDANRDEALAIAASGRIDTLYLEKAEEADTNTSANGTHRASTTYALGWRGAGIRVAVLENNGIDPNCPHLNVVGWYLPWFPNPDDHVHGTSGCIASQLSSRRGGAPSVSLYSANATSYSDSAITAAADWITTRNIEVTNMSYGGNYNGNLQYKDRYFDYQSRVYQDSYVASAGNSGNWVGSPGTAWNCITVGSFTDNDTSSWSNDGLSSFSSWRDPLTGCEKPNLSGVGHLVDTLGMAPDWLRNNYSGTSFSSPFTAAALAVTMTRDSSARVSPEAAMAAMMVSAWHNIEGSTRLSEKDGAGGLHGRAAAYMGNNNRIRYVYLNSGSFTNNGYYTYNISLNAGDRARVCIAWSANANSSYNSTLLNADLDLAVFRGANRTSGSAMGYSSSWNNNFEIVEFTPTIGGTYTIRINDYRFDGSSERVGLAWSQRSRDSGY